MRTLFPRDLSDQKRKLMAMIGTALFWPLEQWLGDGWNDERKEAGTQVYGVLSSTMIEASRQAAA